MRFSSDAAPGPCGGGVGGDGVFAFDFAGVEVAAAALAEDDGGHVVGVADDHAEAFVGDEGVDHAGVGLVEFVERDLAGGEVEVDLGGVAAAVGGDGGGGGAGSDEPSADACDPGDACAPVPAAGGFGGELFAAFGDAAGEAPGEFAAFAVLLDVGEFAGDALEAHGAGVAADGLSDGGALGELLLDELLDGHAVALLEGGAEGLAVVGEDDQAVGARGLFGDHAAETGEGLVEALEVAKGVARPGARVVGDLVVAEIEHVDGGGAAQHVEHGHVGGHVAHGAAHGGADEGVPVLEAVEARVRRA